MQSFAQTGWYMVTWEDCFNALLQREPELLPKLCAYIASGGSELDYCEKEGVLFGDLMNWIWSNDERRAAFESASSMRENWMKQAVIREMKTLALSDIRACFDDAGNVKSPKEWPASVAKAIASFEIDEIFAGQGEDRQHIGYKKRIKFWDKGKQLEALAKKMGFFVEKHEHSLGKSLEDLIVGSFKDGEPKK